MYLIKLVTQSYLDESYSEKIIGYVETEEKAKEFCDAETPKLEYDEGRYNIYYTYKRIDKLR